MTRDELLELSRLVSGEVSTTQLELRNVEVREAMRRMEALAALSAPEPGAADVAAAARAMSGLNLKSPFPRVFGAVGVIAAVVAAVAVGTAPDAAEPSAESSHVTRDNPSQETTPMKLTPRSTIAVALVAASGATLAAAPQTIQVTPGIPRSIPATIERFSFEPVGIARGIRIGGEALIISAMREGSATLTLNQADGGTERYEIISKAESPGGVHALEMIVGNKQLMHLHGVNRWDVGDASLLEVTRDESEFTLKGLRVGQSTFRAWDADGRSGQWNVTVNAASAPGTISLTPGTQKVLTRRNGSRQTETSSPRSCSARRICWSSVSVKVRRRSRCRWLTVASLSSPRSWRRLRPGQVKNDRFRCRLKTRRSHSESEKRWRFTCLA